MKEEDYIKVSPEFAVQAKKFKLPRYALQKGGDIGYARDVQPGDKNTLYLIKRDWLKMLDILINEKPVRCSRELLVAMKAEAKYEASIAKKEKDKTAFVSSIAKKLACFLEAAENHNLSHLFKGNAVKRELPDFLSVDEKEKLTKMYRFPAKEQTVVADRSIRYQEAAVR